MSGGPDLGTLALTYPEVGATAGALPSGYHRLEVTRVVGHGRAWFDEAAARLLSWQVQRRAGATVAATVP